MNTLRTASLASLAVLLCACAGMSSGSGPSLDDVIAGNHRPAEDRARDRYRHPKETLEFFGLKPDMTVVEIWPSGGWYTEILAPYLRGHGKYYAAGFVVSWRNSPQWRKDSAADFRRMLDARPDLYDRVSVTELGLPDRWQPCPPGTADMVLTFRNVHNWLAADYDAQMFKAFYDALKPGGVLGVVEHRAPAGTSIETTKKTGYVTEEYVIQAAQAAGFKIEARSQINANPNDTKDYPEGVWTLPPTLRLGEKNRDRYLAIGESDRMTLKFVKPATKAPGG